MEYILTPMFAAAAISGVYLTLFGVLIAVAFGLSVWALAKPNPVASAVAVLLLCVALLLLAFGGK